MRTLLTLTLLALLGACDTPAPARDAGADAGPPVDAGPDRSAICAELGLPVRAFDEAADGSTFESVAGDFSVETLDGTFTLSERWSGCESFVMIAYSNSSYGQGLFGSAPDGLFAPDAPRNVHYLFASNELDGAAISERMVALRAFIEEGFTFLGLSAADIEHWRSHVHFVVTPLSAAGGSLGAMVASQGAPNALGITRQQRWDPVGSLFQVGGTGFVPRMEMARYVAPYYDFMHDLDARLESEEGVTTVPLLEAETTNMRVIDRAVTVPDTGAFDTLEVDVELTCHLSPDGCSEWDRIAAIFVCADSSCAETRELARWITPYSRPGRRRWAIDASPLLGLLEPGEQSFRLSFGPSWEEATERVVSVTLRLSNRGETAAGRAQLAFRGGTFDATYNEGREPFRFTPDAAASRTELVVIVSGHGQEAGNCAEWCNHVHRFTIGGVTHEVSFDGQAGQARGCAERSGQGVPPGQWGNWAPLRAGWCPGLPLELYRFDVSDSLTAGAENQLTYEGTFGGGEPQGGTIDLSAYVVEYR